MTARRIMDVIAGVAILAALVAAGIGQFMPWVAVCKLPGYATHAIAKPAGQAALAVEAVPGPEFPTAEAVAEFQMWHVTRSGSALVAAAVLVLASLALNLAGTVRKLLVMLLFASLAVAICFEAMIYTPLPVTPAHVQFGQLRLTELPGFFVALVPTIIAALVCAAQMVWTMAWRPTPDANRPSAPA